MKFYVYILNCFKNGKFSCYYVGQTSNLKARIGEHFDSVVEHNTDKFVGRFDFVKLKWYTKVAARAEALKVEKYLKSLTHEEKDRYMENN